MLLTMVLIEDKILYRVARLASASCQRLYRARRVGGWVGGGMGGKNKGFIKTKSLGWAVKPKVY